MRKLGVERASRGILSIAYSGALASRFFD